MKIFCFALFFVLTASQVVLVSPQARSGNSNIRVIGSTDGINPCGNGSDGEQRPSRNPVAVFWHGGNATNISINFGNLNSVWSMSVVPYTNNTAAIAPNSTIIPLPIPGAPVELRGAEKVNTTTNGSLNYVLRNFQWPLDAAKWCRPNFYGCALQIRVTNSPFANDTYFTCSDIRVYSKYYDSELEFTVKMPTDVEPPAPAIMLSRLRLAYATKGLLTTNSKIVPDGVSFALRSDKTFTFTLVVSDAPNFNSGIVTAAISADASTSLATTLGVATVSLSSPPVEESGSGGATAAIVIIVLLLVAFIAVLLYVKVKKPVLWKSWGDSLSNCRSSCKPAKGTNI